MMVFRPPNPGLTDDRSTSGHAPRLDRAGKHACKVGTCCRPANRDIQQTLPYQ